MVTAAAQVKPFITGKEIKSNRKPAGDTTFGRVMLQELKHPDGSDSHSGTVCGWTEEVITVVVGSGSAVCSIKPPHLVQIGSFLGFFIFIALKPVLCRHVREVVKFVAPNIQKLLTAVTRFSHDSDRPASYLI